MEKTSLSKPFPVKMLAESTLPTADGPFTIRAYALGDEEVVLLLRGEIEDGLLVRIHSSCLTGETFRSCRCDCREQLDQAMKRISKENAGAIIYLRQEGRGIGLAEKLKAYALQDDGLDTYEANVALGHPPDAREYSAAATLLQELGISQVRLLTNNPEKTQQLKRRGINVSTEPLQAVPNRHSTRYLETKRTRFGHRL